MVATAMRSVSGIECESAKRTVFFSPRMFKNTVLAASLKPIMMPVISAASRTTPSIIKALSLNVEPICTKNVGTKKPKPKLASLCGRSFL